MELSREMVDRIGELLDMGLDDDAICAVIVKEYAMVPCLAHAHDSTFQPVGQKSLKVK